MPKKEKLNEQHNSVDALIIGFDCTKGKDHTVLLVGRQNKNRVAEIINAFSGEEAEELYKKLTTKQSN